MNFNEIKSLANKIYSPIFALESSMSHKVRSGLEMFLRVILLLFALASALFYSYRVFIGKEDVVSFVPQVFGITSILFVLWCIFFVLESFYYSYYYLDSKNFKDGFLDFDLAYIIIKLPGRDLTREFFESEYGRVILMRCGVQSEMFQNFLSKRKLVVDPMKLKCEFFENHITLKNFVSAILSEDKELADFLFTFGVQNKELSGISLWITELKDSYKDAIRWWSHENLNRIPSLGQNWSYGQIYTLQKYERGLSSSLSGHYRVHSSYGVNELKELEAVLSRSRDANAMLVGNDESGSLGIVSSFSNMIFEGTVVAQLKHKRVVVLDGDLMLSINGDKASFELEFIQMMRQAISAGNVVLVIPNFPSFLASSQGIGVDLPSLIDPYLSSTDLQVIALSDNERFHQLIEKNAVLSQHFETILIKDIDNTNTIKVLENEVIRYENQGLVFTYQAVEEIATGAERYFPGGIMPDKAIDLLLEIVPKLQALGKSLVEKKDILALIETKTGIPIGEVTAGERDKLLNLEEVLHKRIVGQDEAVVAISNAVRRSRSGVTNPNRPMGSFLFLGPTGVGKTETTKALAETFFGAQANILRLDMSEYSSNDATSKLIGSFEGGQDGVLSTMLREHPYGVLLLDEFEKTTKEVMNLFLQILDEGVFSDMSGKKVSARNLIIIATSNAGSDLIWEAMKAGQDLGKAKDSIVDSIIKNGIFKPELLNRFDGVILFHPLKDIHLRKIAEMMLTGLHKRLAEKGINLEVNEDLINYVTSFGTDPKFGARPMNRAIQEKVEEIIAKKIIAGSIPKGTPLVLSNEDLVIE